LLKLAVSKTLPRPFIQLACSTNAGPVQAFRSKRLFASFPWYETLKHLTFDKLSVSIRLIHMQEH